MSIFYFPYSKFNDFVQTSTLYDYHEFLIQLKPFSNNHASLKDSSSKIVDTLVKKLNLLLKNGEEDEEEAQLILSIFNISLSKELFTSEKRNLVESFTKKNFAGCNLDSPQLDISDYFKQLQKHPSSLRMGLGLCDFEGNLGKKRIKI